MSAPSDRAIRPEMASMPYGPYHYRAYRSPHIGHKNHLCELCSSGECSLETVKALVKNPKFVCKTCGRAAAKEENLCEPVPL